MPLISFVKLSIPLISFCQLFAANILSMSDDYGIAVDSGEKSCVNLL